MLNPLQEEMSGRVRTIKLSPPQIPYISNVTGTWILPEQTTDPDYWARHMCQTVRFADGVQQLLHDPDLFVLEVGPGRTLTSFVKQHPACGMARMCRVQAALPAAHEHLLCQSYLLNTIGKLWQAGVSMNWTGFHAYEQRQHISLPICP
jgi:acyl transferase domain-containing protein